MYVSIPSYTSFYVQRDNHGVIVRVSSVLGFNLILLPGFIEEEFKSQHSHFHVVFPSKHHTMLIRIAFIIPRTFIRTDLIYTSISKVPQ